MRKQIIRIALTVAVLGGPAWAQSIEVPEVESPASEGNFFVRGAYGHRFETEFDDFPGEFETNDARGEIGGTAAFDSGIRWMNFLGYGYNNYDSDAVDANVHNLTLASIVDWDLNPCWTMMAGPLASVYAEEGADWGDSMSFGGLLGATYSDNPDLSIGLAVAAMSRIEEGIAITPIPLVRWNFAPAWRLYAGITEVAARKGIGSYVAWAFADSLELAGGVQFEKRRFRLEDKGAFSEGIIEDKSIPVYARLSWEMVESLNLDVYAGAAFGGELEINDPDDHFVGDDKYDAAPLVGARLRYEISGL